MKNLKLLLLTLFIIGCETKNAHIHPTDVVINGVHLETYHIDGCEYIGFVGGSSSVLSHKGNCEYCLKRK